jgi:hypothetical protein
MKAIHFIYLLIFPGFIAQAQNKFVVKSLQNTEVLSQYSTRDESGNTLELLAAIQVSLNQKECDSKGVPLLLQSIDKKEYSRPALYCWNPILRCWKKNSGLQKTIDNNRTVYNAMVYCPGVYAFLDAPVSVEKRLLIALPSKCTIKNVSIIQQSPAYSVFGEGKGSNKLELPFGPLQFDAVMEVTWEEAGMKKTAAYLCGTLTHIEDAPEAGEPRRLDVKPGKTIEFQSALFTNK